MVLPVPEVCLWGEGDAAHHAQHQKLVAMSLDEGAGYRSNQGMIWNELAMKSERMATHSATGAMADLFEGQKDRLGENMKDFRLVDCQVGVVFAIDGRVVGLEFFGYQKTFAKFFFKLVKSYAMIFSNISTTSPLMKFWRILK